MPSTDLLSTLPAEILFAIFRLLYRPSKLSLGLAGPQFLHLFAKYYDLDRYKDDVNKWEKIGLPEGVSWKESAAQPKIIRWLCASGCDDIDNPPPEVQEEKEEESPTGLPDYYDPMFYSDEELLGDLVPYERTDEAQEDMMVENIISDWLGAKFNIDGGCILCAGCYRYMLVLGPDGKTTPWSMNMLSRPA